MLHSIKHTSTRWRRYGHPEQMPIIFTGMRRRILKNGDILLSLTINYLLMSE